MKRILPFMIGTLSLISFSAVAQHPSTLRKGAGHLASSKQLTPSLDKTYVQHRQEAYANTDVAVITPRVKTLQAALDTTTTDWAAKPLQGKRACKIAAIAFTKAQIGRQQEVATLLGESLTLKADLASAKSVAPKVSLVNRLQATKKPGDATTYLLKTLIKQVETISALKKSEVAQEQIQAIERKLVQILTKLYTIAYRNGTTKALHKQIISQLPAATNASTITLIKQNVAAIIAEANKQRRARIALEPKVFAAMPSVEHAAQQAQERLDRIAAAQQKSGLLGLGIFGL